MNVFVESNFVLELAFRQKEHEFCTRIWQAAGPTTFALHLPQYALTEVFQTLRARREQRDEARDYLLNEINQHRREAESDGDAMDNLTAALNDLLLTRRQVQTQQLYAIAAELAESAITIPLTPAIIREAYEKARQHGLASQDSLVYASVLAGLRALPNGAKSLFVSRNKTDFGKAVILEELLALKCEYVTSFEAAAGKLRV
jgi:predicted nucleic acid-binding protein